MLRQMDATAGVRKMVFILAHSVPMSRHLEKNNTAE